MCRATEAIPLVDVYNAQTGQDAHEFIIRKIRHGSTLDFTSRFVPLPFYETLCTDPLSDNQGSEGLRQKHSNNYPWLSESQTLERRGRSLALWHVKNWQQ